MKTYAFGKKLAATVFAICLSWSLFGQSTATSGAGVHQPVLHREPGRPLHPIEAPSASDSLSQVWQYVAHSNAILDSLTRFEFLKLRSEGWSREVNALQARNLSLMLSLARSQAKADSLSRHTTHLARKKARARSENWAWRGLVVFLLYTVLK